MLELFIIFLSICVLIFPYFFCCRKSHDIYTLFICLFIIINISHLVIISLLLSKNFYKNTIFWEDTDYQFIHFLPSSSNKYKNIIYSLDKTIQFSKECFENFFVNDEITCPSSYISNSSNITEFNEKEIIKEKEVKRAINNLKNYSDYSDIICLSLFFISLPLIILISFYYSVLFHIITIFVEIGLLILYLFRYIKFIDLKNAFEKYEDFVLKQYNYYSSNEYFHQSDLCTDSFSVAVLIIFIIILILYTPLFAKCLFKYDYLKEDMDKKTYIIFSRVFGEIILFTTIIYLVKLIDNHKEIKDRFSNINNNWNLNPIKSINLSLSDENESGRNKINWKNNYIIYEALNKYNYINIIYDIFYENKYINVKICGKDTYGNDLYFPLEEECPINDIVITKDKYFDMNDLYTKLNLKNNFYLYFTNKKLDGKIINGLLITEKINNLDIKTYSKIDKDDNIYLLSSYYSGIDLKSLPKKEKIENFENKLNINYRMLIAIIVLLSICYFTSFFWHFEKVISISSFVFSLVLIICTFILSIIIYDINQNYIINIMNKINVIYENRHKIYFFWEIMLIIHEIIVIIILMINIIYFSYHSYSKKKKKNNYLKRKNIKLKNLITLIMKWNKIKNN